MPSSARNPGLTLRPKYAKSTQSPKPFNPKPFTLNPTNLSGVLEGLWSALTFVEASEQFEIHPPRQPKRIWKVEPLFWDPVLLKVLDKNPH